MFQREVVGFVVLGAYVRPFNPINGCHSDANYVWTLMLLFGRSGIIFVVFL